MISLIQFLVAQCVTKGYISQDQAPWLQYSLEKKLSTFLIIIPFGALGVYLTSVPTAAGFLISFYYLRNYTNGYHAKTVLGCLGLSLIFELFFLGLLYRILNNQLLLLLLVLSCIIILWLAPYKHPNFVLTVEEFEACKKSARKRVCVISAITLVFYGLSCGRIFFGLSLGTAMVAFLLALAYLLERRKKL